MSFKGATAGFHIDERKTTLHLIGGRDCVPGAPLTAYTPDLWIRGGSAIEKSLCVLGNIYTEGTFVGNLCSQIALTETLSEKFLGEGISVLGNLIMDGNSTLFAGAIVADKLTVNEITSDGDLIIDPKGNLYLTPGGNVDLNGGNILNVSLITGSGNGLVLDPGANNYVTIEGMGLDLNGGDICNVDLLKTMTMEASNVTIFDTLSVPNIENVQTIFGNGDVLVCTNGDIEIKPMGGNLILHNTAIAFDISQNILSNIMCIIAGPGNDLCLETDNAHKVHISAGGGLDMEGRPICNAGNLTVGTVLTDAIYSDTSLLLCATNEIELKSNGKVNISSGDGIDLAGGDLCNAGTVQAQNIITETATANLITANTACLEEILVDSITPKNTANIDIRNADMVNFRDGDIDMFCNDIGNVMTLEVACLRAKQLPYGDLTPVFERTLGNGDDGETLGFHPGLNKLFHFSGIARQEQFMETVDPISLEIGPNLFPNGIAGVMGLVGNEITGVAWYPPLQVFVIGSLSSTFFHLHPDGSGNIRNDALGVGNAYRGLAVVKDKLYGGDNTGMFHDIDPDTGLAYSSTQAFSSTGVISGLNGLAAFGDRVFVIYKNPLDSGGPRLLGEINVDTAEVTYISNLGDRFAGMAFDNAGKLWLVTGNGADVPETLYSIEGVCTAVKYKDSADFQCKHSIKNVNDITLKTLSPWGIANDYIGTVYGNIDGNTGVCVDTISVAGHFDMNYHNVGNVNTLTVAQICSPEPTSLLKAQTNIGPSSGSSPAATRWQTFVIVDTFPLGVIRPDYFPADTGQVLNLYEGAGTGGTLLASVTNTVIQTNTALPGPDYDFSSFGLILTPGSYTLEIIDTTVPIAPWTFTATTDGNFPSFPFADTFFLEVFRTTIKDAILVCGNVDMLCNEIGNLMTLEVDTIRPKELNGNITLDGNIVVSGIAYLGNISGGQSVVRVDKTSGPQMIADGASPTTVTLDASVHVMSVNAPATWNGSDTFTMTAGAWYNLDGAINFGTGISSKFGVLVLVNGSSADTLGQTQYYSTTTDALAHHHAMVYLSPGDTVTLGAFQTTGVSQGLTDAYLAISRV